MAECEALLQAILADPTDDHLRLVYADALEEKGFADRAEFIRVQVELWQKFPGAALHPESVNPRQLPQTPAYAERYEEYAALHRRERELLGVHGYDWGRCLVELAKGDGLCVSGKAGKFYVSGAWNMEWEFCRGFVEEITLSWESWRDHADAILKAQPVRDVRLTSVVPITVNFQEGSVFLDAGEFMCFDHLYLPAAMVDADEVTKMLLKMAWPQMEFHLPQDG